MDNIKCFMIEPTGRKVSYRFSMSDKPCPNAQTPRTTHYARGEYSELSLDKNKGLGPETCSCGYQFTKDERNSGGTATEWKRLDTGELLPLGDRWPIGAMWDAHWLVDNFDTWDKSQTFPWKPGPDGRCLMVMTPGGEWCIDSRASNCTMPTDNDHCCWVRHGEVPNITVDKNGLTCAAGAGSIQCGSYHGFLRNGHLVLN